MSHATLVPEAELTPAARRPRTAARLTLHVAWILALTLWTVERVGRMGFNPTDQGFILAGSWRLLHGQVPHADAASVRPMGSAVLHVIDFAVPGPLFLASCIVTMLELVVSAVAMTVLATGRPVVRWGPLLTGATAAAALVNLGMFPLMAWHTIDGILLSALGWWALDVGLRTERALPRCGGLFLLGVAVMCKQSFAPAVVVGLAMLVAHPAVRARGRWTAARLRATVGDLLALAAFPVAYVVVVTAAGGLGDMIDQLGSANAVTDQRLVDIWSVVPASYPVLGRPGLLTALVLAGVLASLRFRRDRAPVWARAADLVVSGAYLALVGYVVWAGRLLLAGSWAIVVLWLLLLATVVDGVQRRAVPWRGLSLVVLAAMASLSWGADSPTLVAGSMALGTAYAVLDGHRRMWRADPEPAVGGTPGAGDRAARPGRRPSRVASGAVVGLVAVGLAAGLVVTEHDHAPYRDRAQSALTAGLGPVAPSMAKIRTNPVTAQYIGQIAQCVREHPARSVAVLPDNPFVYPALGLSNPFPVDWPLPLEMTPKVRQRMLDVASELDRRGDYLVMFQTVSTTSLPALPALPSAVAGTTPIVVESGLEPQLLARLTGTHLSCGSFVAVWRPAR